MKLSRLCSVTTANSCTCLKSAVPRSLKCSLLFCYTYKFLLIHDFAFLLYTRRTFLHLVKVFYSYLLPQARILFRNPCARHHQANAVISQVTHSLYNIAKGRAADLLRQGSLAQPQVACIRSKSLYKEKKKTPPVVMTQPA